MVSISQTSFLKFAILPRLHATAIDLPSLPRTGCPADGAAFERVTPALVSRIFPQTPLVHIAANLPVVLTALVSAGLTDIPMLLAALGTIRAETECFEPVSEQVSALNTSPGGHPFDLYDHRAGLGNLGTPDGERFRGRGFVQLTGRANYVRYGLLTGLDLLGQPELACEPVAAATILARFLADRQDRIRMAMTSGELAQARRLVNGGSNGLERFVSTVRLGAACLA